MRQNEIAEKDDQFQKSKTRWVEYNHTAQEKTSWDRLRVWDNTQIQWGLHKTINPERVSILHIIDQVQPQTFTDNLQDPNKNDRELIDFLESKKKYENETFNTLLSY